MESFNLKKIVKREMVERQTRAILIGGETKGSIRAEKRGRARETIAD